MECDLGRNFVQQNLSKTTKSSTAQATPLMHTESRRRARLQKQGLVYRRNQELKRQTIEAAAMKVKKAQIDELIES